MEAIVGLMGCLGAWEALDNPQSLVEPPQEPLSDFGVRQREVKDEQRLHLLSPTVLLVQFGNEIRVDHAVQKQMLKREVDLHLDHF